MFKNIEDPELNGLTVLLPEALHVLRHLDLGLLVAELRVRLGVAREFRLRDIKPLKWGKSRFRICFEKSSQTNLTN